VTTGGDERVVGARKRSLVLCVDDDINIRGILQHILQEDGYTPMMCPSGSECLSILDRVEARLILLDVDMPEMDGFTTCSKVRERYPNLAAKIIFLTGRRTIQDAEEAKVRGGHDFIVKPFTADRLVKRLDHWIGY